MSAEILLETASVVAAGIGLAASLYALYSARKKVTTNTEKGILSVIQESGRSLDMVGITLAQLLKNDEISSLVREKIRQGVRVRAILPDESAVEQWGKSIGLPNEKILEIEKSYEESARRLEEYGIELRLINRVAPSTFVASDYAIANKVNYMLSLAEPGPTIVVKEVRLVTEYKNMFEKLWQEATQVIIG